MTEVISSEELMFHIEKTNEMISKRVEKTLPARERNSRNNRIPGIQDCSSTVVISMDVCVLYTSISK